MKTINATKGEFVNLINGLFAVQELKGKKFSLSVSKNIILLREELKELEDMGKPSEEFMKLSQKVNEIANENSKDSKEIIDKLEEENKELVEKRRKQMADVTVKMAEEMEVKLNVIPENSLPNEITAKQINQLEQIIK